MADSVFVNSANSVAGTFSVNNGGMSAGPGIALGLVTNVGINYSQSINRLFDMNLDFKKDTNTSPMYYVGGRAQGNATIGRVLGPKGGPDDYCDFYKEYGNVCGINESITFNFSGDLGVSKGAGQKQTCTKKEMKFTIMDPIMTSIGITQNSNDVIINENVTMMFVDLKCGPATGGGTAGGSPFGAAGAGAA